MKKDELIDFATSMDIDINERMKKQEIIDMILENEGIERGTRYHYYTDYPSCETIIREVYKCYGDNSNLKQNRDEIKELKKQLEAVNERIRRLRRQTFSNDPKMRRDDERDMKNALKLKQQVEKNIKIAEKKILELEYQCQRQIYGLIDCEKYRVKRPGDEEIEIEKPEDWEERNKPFVPKRIELEEPEGPENDEQKNDDSDEEFVIDNATYDKKKRKNLKFKEGVDEIEFESNEKELEDRKKFNDCIKQRLKLSKQTKLPKLKEVLLKLNPKYDMKGKKRKDIVAEILKIKKCDKLIDVTLDDDEFEEEYVIDDVTYEDIDDDKNKKTPKQISLPPLQSEREKLLFSFKIAELKDILSGYKVKGVSKMKKDDMIRAILEHEGIKEGVKWGDKGWLLQDLKDATVCNDPTNISGVKSLRFSLSKQEEKLSNLKSKSGKTDADRTNMRLISDNIQRLKMEIKKCEDLLSRDLQKEYDKKGGSAMRGFTKAMSKINPMSIALSHKKSRNFMTIIYLN